MATSDERPAPAASAVLRLHRNNPNPAARTVHVIDDDEPVRRAVAMLLQSAGMPVETYPSGIAFLNALPTLDSHFIGCVLSDVRMPDMDGLELLRRLRESGFRRPVVVMTAHGDISTAVQAMKAGAADFIEKPFDEQVLLEACAAALRASPSSDTTGIDAAARVAALSGREREVLRLLMAGKSNKQIAFELNISSRTVEVHRANLMARLGVGSLAEAVRLAMQAELGQRQE